MKLEIIITILVFGTFLFFYLKPLIQLRQDRKAQELLINPNDLETYDLRIWSKSHRNILYNFGDKYDYLKFCFTDNEVFVFMRNSLPGIYNGPFLIKEKSPKKYSYLGKLDLFNFSVNGNDVKVSFGHRNIIGMRYSFHLKNVSDSDINLLKKNLC